MNEFELTGKLDGINFAPTSELEEILQNARTIIATRRGSVPNDRAFGLSWDIIDRPMAQAKAAFSEDVISQLKKYEPRARVLRIELTQSVGGAIGGVLKPRVIIGVNL